MVRVGWDGRGKGVGEYSVVRAALVGSIGRGWHREGKMTAS